MEKKNTEIVLNVGGTKFSTSRTTLGIGISGFFKGLVQSEVEDQYFIDRDPTHFRHILNALRGSPTFPPSPSALRELEMEAAFYLMPEAYIEFLKNEGTKTETVSCVLKRMLHRMHSM